MDVSLSELREMVMDREACRAAIHWVAKGQTWLRDWTELTTKALAESFQSCNISFLKEKERPAKVFYLNVPTE